MLDKEIFEQIQILTNEMKQMQQRLAQVEEKLEIIKKPEKPRGFLSSFFKRSVD